MFKKEFFEAVKHSGLPMYELAKIGGLHQTQFSQLINGTRKVKKNDPRILEISRALGLKDEDVFLEDEYLLPVWRDRGILNSPRYGTGRNIISHMRHLNRRSEMRKYPRDGEFLLCAGAACGICEDGLVRHVQLEFIERLKQKFAGFVVQNIWPDQVLVELRGGYLLVVEGLENNSHHREKVFSFGPNSFTIEHKGLEIGLIDFIQPGAQNKAYVLFRPHDDRQKFRFSTIRNANG